MAHGCLCSEDDRFYVAFVERRNGLAMNANRLEGIGQAFQRCFARADRQAELAVAGRAVEYREHEHAPYIDDSLRRA